LAVLLQVQHLARNKQADVAKKVAEDYTAEMIAKQRKAAEKWKIDQKSKEEKLAESETNLRRHVQYQTARALFGTGDRTESVAMAQALAKEAPDADGVQMLLADIAMTTKKSDEAMAIYESILKKEPHNYIAANNLAWMYAMENNKAKEALAIMRVAQKGKHGDRPLTGDRLPSEFLDTMGVVVRKLNDRNVYAEMCDLFEAARRRYPSDPRMTLHLAYAKLGAYPTQVEEARALFQEALKIAATPEAASFRDAVTTEVQAALKTLP
jgi:tetratricopeptide (TPR) repeat protein